MVPCSAACQSRLQIERTAQFRLLTGDSTKPTPLQRLLKIPSHQSPHPAKGLYVSLHNIITLQWQPIDLLLSGDYLAIPPLTLSGSKVRAGFVEPTAILALPSVYNPDRQDFWLEHPVIRPPISIINKSCIHTTT